MAFWRPPDFDNCCPSSTIDENILLNDTASVVGDTSDGVIVLSDESVSASDEEDQEETTAKNTWFWTPSRNEGSHKMVHETLVAEAQKKPLKK